MLQKSSIGQTLEIFFQSPTKEYSLIEISRQSKLAHTSTKKNIDELLKLELIQQRVEKRGQRKFPLYKANRNKEFIKYKKIYNLSELIFSGLVTYIEEKLMPKCIVVFGSYQRGEDIEGSDIDLFVEVKNNNINLKPFEKKLQRKIELHFKEKFSDYSKELKNNIINGSVLHGFVGGFS